MAWEARSVSTAAHMFASGKDPILDILNALTQEGISPKTIIVDRNPALQGQIRLYYYKEDR